jgi:hypothetical protein
VRSSCVVQHLLGQKLLEPPVLVLQRPQPLGVGRLHAAELGLPLVEGRPAMPAAKVLGLGPRASCSFRIPMICSSVNLALRIVDLLATDSTIRWRKFLGAGQWVLTFRHSREVFHLSPKVCMLCTMKTLLIFGNIFLTSSAVAQQRDYQLPSAPDLDPRWETRF